MLTIYIRKAREKEASTIGFFSFLNIRLRYARKENQRYKKKNRSGQISKGRPECKVDQTSKQGAACPRHRTRRTEDSQMESLIGFL